MSVAWPRLFDDAHETLEDSNHQMVSRITARAIAAAAAASHWRLLVYRRRRQMLARFSRTQISNQIQTFWYKRNVLKLTHIRWGGCRCSCCRWAILSRRRRSRRRRRRRGFEESIDEHGQFVLTATALVGREFKQSYRFGATRENSSHMVQFELNSSIYDVLAGERHFEATASIRLDGRSALVVALVVESYRVRQDVWGH